MTKEMKRNQCAQQRIASLGINLLYVACVAIIVLYIVWISTTLHISMPAKFAIACVAMFIKFLVECGADWLHARINQAA